MPLKKIGTRLRLLRQKKGLTLEQLGERADVSPSAISQIERGVMGPSLETLWTLSQTLEVSLFQIFEDLEREPVTVVRGKQRRRIDVPDGYIAYELLTPSDGRAIEFFYLHVQPNERDVRAPMSHVGEECGVVLDGVLEVTVEDEGVLVLEPGDAVYLMSDRPHTFSAQGPEPVVAVWAMTPPNLATDTQYERLTGAER